MPSYRELLAAARRRISEIEPAEAEARLGSATFLDVREQDEFEQGMIAGSVFIPRGHLESQAESKLGPKDQPIIIYCAAGNRSVFATETLEQLGYQDVVSMADLLELVQEVRSRHSLAVVEMNAPAFTMVQDDDADEEKAWLATPGWDAILDDIADDLSYLS